MPGFGFCFGTRAQILARSSPLDAFAASLYAAYSLRRLVSTWTGPLVTVRRSSDNATLDIYARGDGWLDTAALLAFTGSGAAFVTCWWDQSGLARHAVQTTAVSQPQIVNATGVLYTIGDKPAIRSVSSMRLVSTLPAIAFPVSICATLLTDTLGYAYARRIIQGANVPNISVSTSGNPSVYFGTTYNGTQTIAAQTPTVISTVVSSGSAILRANGVEETGNAGSIPWPEGPVSLLNYPTADRALQGLVGDIVIFSTALTSAQLAALDTALGVPLGVLFS